MIPFPLEVPAHSTEAKRHLWKISALMSAIDILFLLHLTLVLVQTQADFCGRMVILSRIMPELYPCPGAAGWPQRQPWALPPASAPARSQAQPHVQTALPLLSLLVGAFCWQCLWLALPTGQGWCWLPCWLLLASCSNKVCSQVIFLTTYLLLCLLISWLLTWFAERLSQQPLQWSNMQNPWTPHFKTRGKPFRLLSSET